MMIVPDVENVVVRITVADGVTIGFHELLFALFFK